MEYLDYKNKGLSHKFLISEDGKFNLTGGAEKASEGLSFWLIFADYFRVYYEDFCPQIFTLIQRPANLLTSLKVLFLARLTEVASKYIPYAKVKSINAQQITRNDFAVGIVFDYNLEEGTEIQSVTFIQV